MLGIKWTCYCRRCFFFTASRKFKCTSIKQESSINTMFSCQSLKHSVPVKKEEDFGLQIKEENFRDGHSRDSRGEMDREWGIKENSEKKGGKEANRGDDSTGDSSKEVRKAQCLSGTS